MEDYKIVERSRLNADGEELYNYFYCNKFELAVMQSFTYKWTIKHVEMLRQEPRFMMTSDIFPLRGYPFLAFARLTVLNNSMVYVSITLRRRSHTEESTEVVDITPKITFVLRDMWNFDPQHVMLSVNYSMLGWTFFNEKREFCFFLTCKHRLFSDPYVVNDSVELLVLVEPPTVSQRLRAVDGALTHEVRHYQQRVNLAKKGLLEYYYFPYFSVTPIGLRMAIRLWMHGHDNFYTKGITLQLSVIGEFSSNAEVLAARDVEFYISLISCSDQVEDLDLYGLYDAEEINFYKDLATYEQIENGFIFDDSIILKIDVMIV